MWIVKNFDREKKDKNKKWGFYLISVPKKITFIWFIVAVDLLIEVLKDSKQKWEILLFFLITDIIQ